MAAYVTLEEFKGAVEIADTVDDLDIRRALDAAAEWIDYWCGQVFVDPDVPASVQQANIILANRWFQRFHAPFGVQEAPISGELARIGDMDPDVALLLGPYVVEGGAGASAGGAVGTRWVMV